MTGKYAGHADVAACRACWGRCRVASSSMARRPGCRRSLGCRAPACRHAARHSRQPRSQARTERAESGCSSIAPCRSGPSAWLGTGQSVPASSATAPITSSQTTRSHAGMTVRTGCQYFRCLGVRQFEIVPAVLAGGMRPAMAAGTGFTCRVASPCGESQQSSNQTTRPDLPPKWPHLWAINATTPRPRPSSEVASSPRTAGGEGDPPSYTAISADACPRHTMTSNSPPLPEAAWARALAASSETHRTASSTAGQPSSVRVTNRRACATCSGQPGNTRRLGRVIAGALLSSDWWNARPHWESVFSVTSTAVMRARIAWWTRCSTYPAGMP